jgi:hypothetical protein
MFLATVAAGPVYRLLGKRDLGTSEFPPIETPLIDGDLAFRQHAGGHTTGPNWPTFLKFAERYMNAAPPSARAAADPADPLAAHVDDRVWTEKHRGRAREAGNREVNFRGRLHHPPRRRQAAH